MRARAFLEGLQEHGYVEGRTIAIEWRWGQDKVERLPELAAAVGQGVLSFRPEAWEALGSETPRIY